MALVISVKEGEKFYIQDTPVEVSRILDPLKFKVTVIGSTMNSVFNISDRVAVEILPGVMVSAGKNGSMLAVKVVIQAPKTIKILRAALYGDQDH